jgi:hypothetical protein
LKKGKPICVLFRTPHKTPNVRSTARHVKHLQFDFSANAHEIRDIHTYHSRLIPEGVAEVSQIFLRDTHVLPKFKLAMRITADVTGGKPIAVLLQSISGLSAINPLVAFYDIHGGKREVLFFYFVPDTTRDQE